MNNPSPNLCFFSKNLNPSPYYAPPLLFGAKEYVFKREFTENNGFTNQQPVGYGSGAV